MQMFDFSPNYAKMLTPDIVALLTQIHEYKGGQALLIEVNADSLPPLLNLTRLQSTKSSNRIEGICTSDERSHGCGGRYPRKSKDLLPAPLCWGDSGGNGLPLLGL